MTDDTIQFVRQFTNEDGNILRRYSDSTLGGRTHDVTIGNRKRIWCNDAGARVAATTFFAHVRRCQS